MAVPDLTDELRREPDRRLADMDANPDDEFSLEEVMAEVDEIIRQVRADGELDKE